MTTREEAWISGVNHLMAPNVSARRSACLRSTRPNSDQRAVALLLVLVVVGVGAALSLGVLQLAAVRALTSHNLVDSVGAGYLAESGLAEAAYVFSYQHVCDPDNPNAVWTGVTRRQIDSSDDYYDVTVTPDSSDPLLFHVASTSHIFGQTAETFSRTVQATFLVNRGFVHTLVGENDLAVPDNVAVKGDVYASGNVVNAGTIKGDVQAAGTISGPGIITGQTTEEFPSLEMWPCNLTDPVTYVYRGKRYNATVITSDTLRKINWNKPPQSNPMGVYFRNGDLAIEWNVQITGTLIVTGTLRLQEKGNRITAMPGFPAIVAKGDVTLEDRESSLTTNGAMIVYKQIIPKTDLKKSSIVVNGPLVFLGPNSGFAAQYFSPPWPGQMGSFAINEDLDRVDVSGLFPRDATSPRQVRQLSFRDN